MSSSSDTREKTTNEALLCFLTKKTQFFSKKISREEACLYKRHTILSCGNKLWWKTALKTK